VREQFYVLRLEGERAIEVLGSLVEQPDARRELLGQVSEIIGAGGAPSAAETVRLERLADLLAVSVATTPPEQVFASSPAHSAMSTG